MSIFEAPEMLSCLCTEALNLRKTFSSKISKRIFGVCFSSFVRNLFMRFTTTNISCDINSYWSFQCLHHACIHPMVIFSRKR